jgi:mono/diheme cytochrome c family protein
MLLSAVGQQAAGQVLPPPEITDPIIRGLQRTTSSHPTSRSTTSAPGKIHPQMDACIVVLQNPCFAVTDKGGRYEIDNVPPGSYTLSAWYARHRQIGLSGWRAYIQMMRLGLLVLALGSILSAPASAQSALAAQGEKVFAAKKCSVCHLVGGVGNKKGQTLDGVGSKLAAEEIRQWITNAPEMAAKANITRKPPMKAYTDFSKEEVDALVAYVATLKK